MKVAPIFLPKIFFSKSPKNRLEIIDDFHEYSPLPNFPDIPAKKSCRDRPFGPLGQQPLFESRLRARSGGLGRLRPAPKSRWDATREGSVQSARAAIHTTEQQMRQGRSEKRLTTTSSLILSLPVRTRQASFLKITMFPSWWTYYFLARMSAFISPTFSTFSRLSTLRQNFSTHCLSSDILGLFGHKQLVSFSFILFESAVASFSFSGFFSRYGYRFLDHFLREICSLMNSLRGQVFCSFCSIRGWGVYFCVRG